MTKTHANIHSTIHSTLKYLLTPIIKVVLRNGMTHKEFSQLSKKIFVETAARDFGINGKESSMSRISTITGLDRKEVKRIKELKDDNALFNIAQQNQNRLTRILTAWHQDKEFLDAQGKPRNLSLDDGFGSFNALVRRFGDNICSDILLKELVRWQAIEQLEDGSIQVLRRNFFPKKSDSEALLRMGSVINDLATSLFNNIYPEHKKNSYHVFERRVTNTNMPENLTPKFTELLEDEGQIFLERIDAWLTEHENSRVNPSKNTPKNIRLGVGMYHIQSDS